MAVSCAWLPEVTTKEGKKIPSPLFKELSKLTKDRELAATIYNASLSSEFRNTNKLKLNEFNEVNFDDLLQLSTVKDCIEEGKKVNYLNSRFGTEFKEISFNERADLLKQANEFNNNSQYNDKYCAVLQFDKDSTRIAIVPKTEDNITELNKQQNERKIHDFMFEYLNKHNIGVDVLDNYEARNNDGITDFSIANKFATETHNFIRLAKGQRGADALSEEFSHVIIESTLNNNVVARFINSINEQTIQEQLGDQYDSYYELYDGNIDILKREVAAKILADRINNSSKKGSSIEERTKTYVKDFYSNLDEEEIINKQKEIQNNADAVLVEIKKDSLVLTTPEYNRQMSKLSKSRYVIDDLQSVIKEARVSEQRKLNTVKKTDRDPEKLARYEKAQNLLIARLGIALDPNHTIAETLDYTSGILQRLTDLTTKLRTITSKDVDDKYIENKAELLREIKTFTNSYIPTLESLQEVIQAIEDSEYEDIPFTEEQFKQLKDTIKDAEQQILWLNNKYAKYSKELFTEYIKVFLDEYNKAVSLKNKVDVDTFMDYISRDISFIDRWLYAAQDSNNLLIRIIDKIVSNQKEYARLDTLDDTKLIQNAALKAEKAGVKDFSFIFEKDENGIPTGKYVTDVDTRKFNKEKKEFQKKLDEKYANQNDKWSNIYRAREYKAWILAHTDEDGSPSKKLYPGKVLSFTKAQKEFYDTFMQFYNKYRTMLPSTIMPENGIICVPKSNFENWKNIKSTKDLGNFLKSTVTNQTQRREDMDTYEVENSTIGYDGNVMEMLPIYFHKKPSNLKWENISTDAVSSLIAFGAMANNYSRMNDVINVLELGRDAARNIEIAQTVGDKQAIEKLKVGAAEVVNKLTKRKGGSSNFMARIDDYYSMQIYGNYRKPEYATILGKTVSLNKVADNLNFITSIYTYAMNANAAIANVTTGWSMGLAEKMANEFFSAKDLLHADKDFCAALPAYIGQRGKRFKNDKLSLFLEQFNVLQEYEKEIKDIDFNKRSRFAHLLDTNSLYFMSNSGELWLQSRTALAMANRLKLKKEDGSTVSLWEALEVVPIDGKDISKGARLQIKKGYKKLDGKEFTKQDIVDFTQQCKVLNQRMHGIYNKQDMNAAQAHAVGQLLFMYKKYLIPAMQKRYQKRNYSFHTHTETEGYYRTLGGFLQTLGQDARRGEFAITAHWNELKPYEKANIRRALTETAQFLALWAFVALTNWKGDDDDDEKRFKKSLEYQARRLLTELRAFTVVDPISFIRSNLKLMDQPIAAFSLADRIPKMANAFKFWDWGDWAEEDDYIKTGKYKGHTKAYRGATYLIPFWSQYEAFTHPEYIIPFYR